MVENAFF